MSFTKMPPAAGPMHHYRCPDEIQSLFGSPARDMTKSRDDLLTSHSQIGSVGLDARTLAIRREMKFSVDRMPRRLEPKAPDMTCGRVSKRILISQASRSLALRMDDR